VEKTKIIKKTLIKIKTSLIVTKKINVKTKKANLTQHEKRIFTAMEIRAIRTKISIIKTIKCHKKNISSNH
jgi:hypothetical protein